MDRSYPLRWSKSSIKVQFRVLLLNKDEVVVSSVDLDLESIVRQRHEDMDSTSLKLVILEPNLKTAHEAYVIYCGTVELTSSRKQKEN